MAQRCGCGAEAVWYGPRGGYSKSCVICNAVNAKRQRLARMRVKMNGLCGAQGPTFWVPYNTCILKKGHWTTKKKYIGKKKGKVVFWRVRVVIHETQDNRCWEHPQPRGEDK